MTGKQGRNQRKFSYFPIVIVKVRSFFYPNEPGSPLYLACFNSPAMRNTSLLLALCLGLPLGVAAQQKLTFDRSCGFTQEITSAEVYGFTSDQDAKRTIDRIMRYTGLPSNFTIQAANVPNAAAIIQNDKRFILYNQYFMESIKDITHTDWSALSIMAHEIGHHLSGHTLDNIGSRPAKELEADRFSGFVLYKMGATLEEARSAMHAIAVFRATSTHPSRSARLAAITNGWMAARELDESITPIQNPPTPPKKELQPNMAPNSTDLSAINTSLSSDIQSKHMLLRTPGVFPNLKEEWAAGRQFVDGIKLLDQWMIITGPKPEHYHSQAYRSMVEFPNKEIKRLWEGGFRITNLQYQENQWLLVMTRFDYNRLQRWRKLPSFPKEEIQKGWEEDYYVTEITHGNGDWVVVMDKKPDDYIGQRYSMTPSFPKDLIQELWDEGYNITSLRFLDKQWVLVMTKFKTFKQQLWRTRKQFPIEEIQQQEQNGYSVSEISYGNGNWSLIMTMN